MTANEIDAAVLFAYVSGSESLFEKLGKTEAEYALDRYVRRIAQIITGLRGQIIKSRNLEILASFSSADDAYRAVVEIQQRVHDLPPVSGIRLAVRVGLHCGNLSEDPDAVDPTRETVSRIAHLAQENQILASNKVLSAFSSVLCYNLCPVEERKFEEEIPEIRIYEILWQSPPQNIGDKVFRTIISGIEAEAEVQPEFESTVTGYAYDERAAPTAVLHYEGKSYSFDDVKGYLVVGRDLNCDLTIKDRKASRMHARIEKRYDQFVLVDISTNGSFVVFDDQPEILIRRQEIVLKKNCILCFGGMPDHGDTERVAFELRYPEKQ